MNKLIRMIGRTGSQGQGLALRWDLAIESVLMGSRNQEKANKIAAEVNAQLGQDLVIPSKLFLPPDGREQNSS